MKTLSISKDKDPDQGKIIINSKFCKLKNQIISQRIKNKISIILLWTN